MPVSTAQMKISEYLTSYLVTIRLSSASFYISNDFENCGFSFGSKVMCMLNIFQLSTLNVDLDAYFQVLFILHLFVSTFSNRMGKTLYQVCGLGLNMSTLCHFEKIGH